MLFYITFAVNINAKIEKMFVTLLFTLLIIAIAMLLLGVRVLFEKDGEFQSQHVSDNAYLKEKGIHCVIEQDKEARMKNKAY